MLDKNRPKLMSVLIHEREQGNEDIERYSKRAKLDDEAASVEITKPALPQVLPPSHSLLGLPSPVIKQGQPINFHEPDVGISEYIGRGDAKIEGIIKQRSVTFQKSNNHLLNPVIPGSLIFWFLKWTWTETSFI